jgi:AraC-like DNA-binding protein
VGAGRGIERAAGDHAEGPVSDIAFASGFESLRGFNVAFHERYGMSPSALRRSAQGRSARRAAPADGSAAADDRS